MIFIEATIKDIPQMQIVRNAVKENVLSNPDLVKDIDYIDYITTRGKGWICNVENTIVGFAICDLVEDNIWALFVHPNFDKRGIGKALHKLMMDWYFAQGKQMCWLSTAPNSRAEQFYKMQGWVAVGNYGKGEIKFEITRQIWTKS
ncbi:MAG: GNAT family N-acetyltransferase [Ferruginibacter sp.]|nr:GNAT family N-acetyltransferase [Ferruginibacter sp.]